MTIALKRDLRIILFSALLALAALAVAVSPAKASGLLSSGSLLSGLGSIAGGGSTNLGLGSLGNATVNPTSGTFSIVSGGITYNSNGTGSVVIPYLGTITFGPNGWGFSFGSWGGCSMSGIGGVMCNVVKASSTLPGLLSAICYLAGLLLGVLAILKLKDHVLNPNQTPISEGLKRFLVGGMLFALPIIINAVYNSLATGITGPNQTAFNTPGVSGGGLDFMITALMTDIWGPVSFLIAGFAYLAGLVLIVIGISRLLKSAQEGPRGPAGVGTIMTFLVGGALLSVDAMMGAFTNSLFATGTIRNFGTLSYAAGLGASADHVHSVISAVLAFMIVIGWISFVRGWFIIREVAEGNQQASLMAGMTHVFGGALAVNLGPALNAIQTTFGITGVGIVFS